MPTERTRAEESRLSNATVGTFIDAVYAIAITLLALEIRGTDQGEFQLAGFAREVVEYVVAFGILFSLWLQHRRIHDGAPELERIGLWLNAGLLLMVCLIPLSTTLVFEYGGDVGLAELENTLLQGGGWTTAEVVDLFCVFVVVAADLGILALAAVHGRGAAPDPVRHLKRSKFVATALLLGVVATSLLLPVENRYFLLIMPIVLFFEREIGLLLPMRNSKANP